MTNPAFHPFLTAEWRHVLMLNYEIDPAVLAPFLPSGLELDMWEGQALVSVVGFRFLNTRVLGLPLPFHQSFEEVNLRFYVRSPGTDRRGVVFIKEIVPRPWIALAANTLYGEHYAAMRMRHTIERDRQGRLRPEGLVEYSWRYRGRLNRLGGLARGEPLLLTAGSEEEFVAEHYWGYSGGAEGTGGAEKRPGATRVVEYPVAHPAWLVTPVDQPYLLCDVAALYGKTFVPFLCRRPRSAYLAEGSPIAVGWGKPLRP